MFQRLPTDVSWRERIPGLVTLTGGLSWFQRQHVTIRVILRHYPASFCSYSTDKPPCNKSREQTRLYTPSRGSSVSSHWRVTNRSRKCPEGLIGLFLRGWRVIFLHTLSMRVLPWRFAPTRGRLGARWHDGRRRRRIAHVKIRKEWIAAIRRFHFQEYIFIINQLSVINANA